MLAVIFTGGEGPPVQVLSRILNGEKPYVIAADSGLLLAEKAGFMPDYIIGDMDSLGDLSLLDRYPPEKVMRYGRDKDYTDTELALNTAIEKGYTDIYLIGGGGGRLDHLLGIRSLFEREIIPKRWITKNEDIYIIGNNSDYLPASITIESEAGRLVSVFPLGIGSWEAQSEGLKWPLKGLAWNRGFFGLSNVAVNDTISVTAIQGRFLIIVPL
jgi:thiamine pyrophosphokinase